MTKIKTPAERLSDMIEYKINQRNKQAQQTPRPDYIVKLIDSELDLLEEIEKLLISTNFAHARHIAAIKQEYFKKGQDSGRAMVITGRPHPIELFT